MATANSRPEYGIAPSFRLPDTAHVGGVHLQVADLQRSLEYYRGVLGLDVLRTSGDEAACGVKGESAPLVTLHAVAGTERAPRRGLYGLFHFAILLPRRADLGRFAAHLAAHGIQPGMADHRVSEALYLTDPDGLGIEVYADRPRRTWSSTAAGELVMTTEPLDLNGVLAEGGGGTWDLAPPGTTMGHVHLHVGDLDQATAFYHQTIGFDLTVWTYPGALFFSAGGYHHHLGTNTWSPGPSPTPEDARLLEWELVLPEAADVDAVGRHVAGGGYVAIADGGTWIADDPWGTRVRVMTAAERGRDRGADRR